jgi:5-methylcytosine-specific restriction endonuclease McrA
VYGGKRARHTCAACKEASAQRGDALRRAARVPDAMRALVYAEANGRCAQCEIHCHYKKANRRDRSDALANIDHVVPVSRGGDGSRSNLQLLCKGCNRKKGVR